MSGLARKCPLDPDRGRGALVTITGPRNVNILNQDHTGSDTGQESRVHFLKNATGRQVRRLPFLWCFCILIIKHFEEID